MSPMTQFLWEESNLCRGEHRSSAWFCTSTHTNVPRRKFCAKFRADMESAPTGHRKFTENCRGAHCASSKVCTILQCACRGRRPRRPARFTQTVGFGTHIMRFIQFYNVRRAGACSRRKLTGSGYSGGSKPPPYGVNLHHSAFFNINREAVCAL